MRFIYPFPGDPGTLKNGGQCLLSAARQKKRHQTSKTAAGAAVLRQVITIRCCFHPAKTGWCPHTGSRCHPCAVGHCRRWQRFFWKKLRSSAEAISPDGVFPHRRFGTRTGYTPSWCQDSPRSRFHAAFRFSPALGKQAINIQLTFNFRHILFPPDFLDFLTNPFRCLQYTTAEAKNKAGFFRQSGKSGLVGALAWLNPWFYQGWVKKSWGLYNAKHWISSDIKGLWHFCDCVYVILCS